MARMHARFLWSWSLVAAVALMMPPPASAAVTAQLVGNQLQVTGDGADDSITLRLLAGDTTQVEVLEGAVVRGTFARATFASILVQAGAGADTILVSDANGVFTDTHVTVLDGGDGNDTITGGGGGEALSGGIGNDVLNGGGGADTLIGGPDNDTLTGGPGVDPHLGGAGDDTMIWNPGDGSEPVDGEARQRHVRLQRRCRRRHDDLHGQRRAGDVLPQPRRDHDGHRHHREPPDQRARRQRRRDRRHRPQRAHRHHDQRRRQRRHADRRRRRRPHQR